MLLGYRNGILREQLERPDRRHQESDKIIEKVMQALYLVKIGDWVSLYLDINDLKIN
jgi:hypothetical protein